jgi:hypothetical protein
MAKQMHALSHLFEHAKLINITASALFFFKSGITEQ